MFELDLPFCIRAESVTSMGFPLRLQLQHFSGVIENRSGCIHLGARPFRVSQRAESRRFFACPDITRDEISLFQRHIKFSFIGKFEHQDLATFMARMGRLLVWRSPARRSGLSEVLDA